MFVLHISTTAEKGFYQEITTQTKAMPNVHFCKREDGVHNGFGIVQGVINALNYLLDKGLAFDYVSLISGQDYPIKSNKQIVEFLEAHKGKEFLEFFPLNPKPDSPFYMNHPWGANRNSYRLDRFHIKITGVTRSVPELHTNRLVDHPLWATLKQFIYNIPQYYRKGTLKTEALLLYYARTKPYPRPIPPQFEYYGGKTWWTFTNACARYIIKRHSEDKVLREFFRYTLIPDEMYFQTMLMNSPFKEACVNDDLRDIEWAGGDGTHPIIFKAEHYTRLVENNSNHFARKFDTAIDAEILDKLDEWRAKN